MNIVAIIQARISSTRFPNKVFSALAGKPLIWHVFNRLEFSHKITRAVLATTTNPNDVILCEWAKDHSIEYFRGDEEDVLARFYETAKLFEADIIVRVTSDDPFKDPEIIDRVIDLFLSEKLDFAYNNCPPSYPEGLDVEVFSFSALERAAESASESYEREHITQFFYRNPELFKQANLSYKENISNLRWTIDTEKDYEMAEKVYDQLYKDNSIFLMNDILQYLEDNPKVSKINIDVPRSLMYK